VFRAEASEHYPVDLWGNCCGKAMGFRGFSPLIKYKEHQTMKKNNHLYKHVFSLTIDLGNPTETHLKHPFSLKPTPGFVGMFFLTFLV